MSSARPLARCQCPDANRRHTARETVGRWSPAVVRHCWYAMSVLGPNQTWQCGAVMSGCEVVRTSGWARETFAADNQPGWKQSILLFASASRYSYRKLG